jgi:hypothetical protein
VCVDGCLVDGGEIQGMGLRRCGRYPGGARGVNTTRVCSRGKEFGSNGGGVGEIERGGGSNVQLEFVQIFVRFTGSGTVIFKDPGLLGRWVRSGSSGRPARVGYGRELIWASSGVTL